MAVAQSGAFLKDLRTLYAEGSIGTLTDGEFLKRVGSTLVSGTPTAVLGDGDYGDVVVSSTGTVLSLDSAVVTTAYSGNTCWLPGRMRPPWAATPFSTRAFSGSCSALTITTRA